MIDFIKQLFAHFSESNTFEKGAALAYYTVFSFMICFYSLSLSLSTLCIQVIIFGELSVSVEQIQKFNIVSI